MNYYLKLRQLLSTMPAQMDKRVLKSIIESYNEGFAVALYGGGLFGKLWIRYMIEDLNIQPKYIVDSDPVKQGGEFEGIPIISLDMLAKEKYSKINLVVTPHVLNSNNEARELFEEQCKGQGFQLFFIPVRYSVALEMRYSIHSEKCLHTIDMLDDELSKASYYEYIRSKLRGEAYTSPYFDYAQQYLATDLFTLTVNDFIVDCGAYEGDTLESFGKAMPGWRGIACFEPTPDTFSKLEEAAERLGKDSVRLFNGATGDKNTTVNFQHSVVTSGNRVSSSGERETQMFALDEVLMEERPTFIKMDVEGSELITLVGARKIIGLYTPILAVCIYHKTEDLHEIPFYIKSLNPAYRLYVRKYSDDPYELVMYAVPPQRFINNEL